MCFWELQERDHCKKRFTAIEFTSQQGTTCLVGIPCVWLELSVLAERLFLRLCLTYWTPPSQGEWSPVHSNACFISPLILIKRILSRLLGINIDWFWHYSCPSGPGLLFQGSCISFSPPHLLFGTWDESKTKLSGNVSDVRQVERSFISSKSE